MPFTTMGTKSFVYGRTMESHEEDFAYETKTQNMDETKMQNMDEEPDLDGDRA